jgi:hypothetical protein
VRSGGAAHAGIAEPGERARRPPPPRSAARRARSRPGAGDGRSRRERGGATARQIARWTFSPNTRPKRLLRSRRGASASSSNTPAYTCAFASPVTEPGANRGRVASDPPPATPRASPPRARSRRPRRGPSALTPPSPTPAPSRARTRRAAPRAAQAPRPPRRGRAQGRNGPAGHDVASRVQARGGSSGTESQAKQGSDRVAPPQALPPAEHHHRGADMRAGSQCIVAPHPTTRPLPAYRPYMENAIRDRARSFGRPCARSSPGSLRTSTRRAETPPSARRSRRWPRSGRTRPSTSSSSSCSGAMRRGSRVGARGSASAGA